MYRMVFFTQGRTLIATRGLRTGAGLRALRAAAVTVVQTAHHRLGHDAATLWPFHRTRLWCILVQTHVRLRLMVIG
jgi:hypothetical protein